MVAHTYNPSTWEVKTDQESKVILSLQGKFEASLGYRDSVTKKQRDIKKKSKTKMWLPLLCVCQNTSYSHYHVT